MKECSHPKRLVFINLNNGNRKKEGCVKFEITRVVEQIPMLLMLLGYSKITSLWEMNCQTKESYENLSQKKQNP